MIESITLSNVASFGSTPEVLGNLSKFNFVFGSNGTGKTTISRVVAAEDQHPTCSVRWKGGTRLEPMVYNHDFVDKNFSRSTELKGVFTLGELQVDTVKKIDEVKARIEELGKRAEGLRATRGGDDGKGGKVGELAECERRALADFWVQKQRLDATLHGALVGVRNNKEAFKQKVLLEAASNTANVVTLAALEERAATLFGQTPTVEAAVPGVSAAGLLAHESSAILRKRVIGKADVDIAAMITKLGNSDWVRQGRTFYDEDGKMCPFCQQSTTAQFTASLNDYFDEAYESDTKAINDLVTNYATDAARLQQHITSILGTPSPFLDVEALEAESQLLALLIANNEQILAAKKRESSQVAELKSLANVVAAIQALISAANGKITAHNKVVANLDQERKTLTAEVWRFIVSELDVDFKKYKEDSSDLDKAIKGLDAQLMVVTAEKTAKEKELRELEKQATSVQPTIDAINEILKSFGFLSFKLAKAGDGRSYRVLRGDGADAKATLSEGEKSFLSFLYFYHLLRGSLAESGTTTNRVVVIDDPVSSLDADILFIVSSLIKGLFDDVRAGKSALKQIFVMTHNVYFHKEVSFNPDRRKVAMNEETFTILRRMGTASKVERHPANPVSTSYELLWSEVRRSDRSNLTIQNTLRRILENYFKILGGVDPDTICNRFHGRERLICKSLFSWVNDGSHFAQDDLFVSNEGAVEAYLSVFRAVFERTEHAGHYKMMMGEAYVAPSRAEGAPS